MRPLSVDILLNNQPLSADRTYDIECQAIGSKPSAKITWWMNGVQLRSFREKVMSIKISNFYYLFILIWLYKQKRRRLANGFIFGGKFIWQVAFEEKKKKNESYKTNGVFHLTFGTFGVVWNELIFFYCESCYNKHGGFSHLPQRKLSIVFNDITFFLLVESEGSETEVCIQKWLHIIWHTRQFSCHVYFDE